MTEVLPNGDMPNERELLDSFAEASPVLINDDCPLTVDPSTIQDHLT
jgi:hypothetical protein